MPDAAPVQTPPDARPAGPVSSPPTCHTCGGALAEAYRFCPHCGVSLDAEADRSLADYRRSVQDAIRQEELRNQARVVLWGGAKRWLALFGLVLFAAPDAVFLLVFSPWWTAAMDGWMASAFLLTDVAVGLFALLLVAAFPGGGIFGELTVISVRLGQVLVLYALRLMPFYHDTLNLALFAFLPSLVLVMRVAITHRHLADTFDAIGRWAARRRGTPGNTEG